MSKHKRIEELEKRIAGEQGKLALEEANFNQWYHTIG